jgi:hypothetical protein
VGEMREGAEYADWQTEAGEPSVAMYVLYYSEDAKKANKANQENMCSYESYIKDIEKERDELTKINKQYSADHKLTIVWIV